ncbi:hypothetical protein TNCV_833351 [Trichonephila clavipes]|nr:hypothetical protein TNCV_833351 [Trichonephila clavipes]
MFDCVLGVGYENGRHSILDRRVPFVKFTSAPISQCRRCSEAVTSNCLGGPPVYRDRRKAHFGCRASRSTEPGTVSWLPVTALVVPYFCLYKDRQLFQTDDTT